MHKLFFVKLKKTNWNLQVHI